MTSKHSRRNLLKTTPLIVSGVSGCIFAPESSSHASLSMDLHFVNRTDGQFRIQFNPQIGVTGDLEPFRNVTVIIRDRNGSVTCRQSIGNLERAGDYDPMNITCESFPQTITYDFERGPCRKDTSVQKMVYNPDENDWIPQRIECSE